MCLRRIAIALSTASISAIPFGDLLGQSTAADSALYTATISNAIERYHASAGDQSAIFNGSQYGGYQFSFKSGSPYFNALSFSKGSIEYDGVLYKNISLLYDQVADVVIMQDAGHHIQLVTSKITAFTILDYSFLRLQTDSTIIDMPRTGFYEQLYKGNISLLKKNWKSIQEEINAIDGLQRFIDDKTQHYILKNGKYYAIKRKSSVLEVLSDKKKELQQYIKKNKLNFRKDRDNMLVKVAAYYDQLTR